MRKALLRFEIPDQFPTATLIERVCRKLNIGGGKVGLDVGCRSLFADYENLARRRGGAYD
jgi:hypothetical protein